MPLFPGVLLVASDMLTVSYRDMVSQINGHNAVQGCCIDIFLAAIKLLPYAVQYKFILFGDGHKNPSYYDLVNMITYDVSNSRCRVQT